MSNKNMSDLIEVYLKSILETVDHIEIRRAEMADLFDCVPSQINYVINTRFTVPKGYRVESKRGGGGYIRIVKIDLLSHSDYINEFCDIVGTEMKESDALAILRQLYENELITKREYKLLGTMFSSKALNGSENEHVLRSKMMVELLERLTYEE